MIGIRTFVSRARAHLQNNKCINCFSTSTASTTIKIRKLHVPSLSGIRKENFLAAAGGNPQFRSFSHYTRTQYSKKSPSHWSALRAALVGIGGALILFKKSDKDLLVSSNNPLFPTVAHCARLGGDKGKCESSCVEKKCDASECLQKTNREDELIQKANSDLERALRDTKEKAVCFTEEALKAYCDAIDALKIFINKVYCAVEDESLEQPRFDEMWCDVENASKTRCDLSKTALETGACAAELLKRLREIIEDGKACKYTKCNRLLVTGEATLVCAEKEFCAKKKAFESLLGESRTAEQFRGLIEDFRRDLKSEADSLTASDDCCKVTYTNNEANMILTHAYKKILRSQKEVSKGGNRRC